ncbi:sigma-54-dependent transcriptional regulator [Fundidesulfovibrio putealis]|uniref:sigma-54-dependent transcriptional regulator n=1 Tax=Fundidesulfovibrio putealis TaxID=270496 RepID=UPI00040CD38C|nr:sigma-54 dependent transcriptional regulator [Fundidesulfovibrio putealis]
MAHLTKPILLVVDDDPGHRTMLRTVLKDWGYGVEEAENGEKAVELVRGTPFDLILMDVRMAGMSGIDALKEIKVYNPAIPVLIMTAYSNVETAIEALKSGAYDYLIKPLDLDVLRLASERALEHSLLKSENIFLRERLGSSIDTQGMIGNSQAIFQVMETVAMIAPSEATVLITGESGTGKELVAKAIHANSPRRNGPFIAVNCAALTESLLESELFGHERGAFTGADKRREGRFLLADKGTIFLDEIGETSAAMQSKLLRVVQERTFERVGGVSTLHVDVRVLAATNRDLQAEVETGRFRADLYYRLNVVTLRLPALRERVEDIPLLAGHFLERMAHKNRKTVKGFTPSAMDCLRKYSWPGNVRELENAIERAVVLLVGDYVCERELPPHLACNTPTVSPSSEQAQSLAGISLEEVEKTAISDTLQACDGNKSETARQLGISRKTLHAKLHRYGLEGEKR